MSTCTDLIDAINAVVVNPNLLAEIDPSTIAVLSNIGTTETVVQLGAGGAAVLSIPASPSVDGIPFQIVVAGTVHYGTGGANSFAPNMYKGSSTTLGSDSILLQCTAGSTSYGQEDSFMFVAQVIWDSTSQVVKTQAQYTSTGTHPGEAANPNTVFSVASQTDLQFVLSGQFSSGNVNNSVTITKFSASLV